MMRICCSWFVKASTARSGAKHDMLIWSYREFHLYVYELVCRCCGTCADMNVDSNQLVLHNSSIRRDGGIMKGKDGWSWKTERCSVLRLRRVFAAI